MEKMLEVKKEITKRIYSIPIDEDFSAIKEEYLIGNKIVKKNEFVIFTKELNKLKEFEVYNPNYYLNLFEGTYAKENSKYKLDLILVKREYEEHHKKEVDKCEKDIIKNPYTTLQKYGDKDFRVILKCYYDDMSYKYDYYENENAPYNIICNNIDTSKKKIIPIPQTFDCEYCITNIDDAHYDLEKLAEFLLNNPDRFKIIDNPYKSYLTKKEVKEVIKDIPYYGKTEKRKRTIVFMYFPSQEEFYKYFTEYICDGSKDVCLNDADFMKDCILKDFVK